MRSPEIPPLPRRSLPSRCIDVCIGGFTIPAGLLQAKASARATPHEVFVQYCTNTFNSTVETPSTVLLKHLQQRCWNTFNNAVETPSTILHEHFQQYRMNALSNMA
jgi:hypothetical protein